ncbi:MAG: phage holin family protein [Actinomycetota bacterium]
MRILIRWAILAVAVFAAAQIVPGIELREGLVSLLIVSAILGLVNAFLGTVLRILSIPFLIVTLGLFAIVINTAVLWVTALFTDRIAFDGFWAYFWAALIISIVTLALRIVLPDGGDD